MIRTDIAGGLASAWRHRGTVVGVALMMAVVCTVLTLALADVITQTSVILGAKGLRERDAVTFTTYYRSRTTTEPSPELMSGLAYRIEAGTAYTAVIGNVEIGNPSFADGHRALVVVGDGAQTAMSGVELCSPAPCAMVGERIKNGLSEPLRLGGLDVPVTAGTPSSAALYDPNATGIDLGTSVLIVLPPSSLGELNAEEREEALTRTVMFSPSDDEVAQFAEEVNQEDLTLVPHRIATDQPERYRELMVRAGLYGLGLLALTGLVLLAYASSIGSTLRRERAELMLRHQYGATTLDTCVRVAVFLASTMLVLPVCALLLFALTGPPMNQAAAVSGAALVTVYLVFLVRTTRRTTTSFSSDSKGGRGP